MSIEQALAENTAALKDHIAIQKEVLASNKALLASRDEAMAKLETVAASAKKGTDKPADKPKGEDKKSEEKGQISTNPEDRRENPYEGIKELIAGYIGGTDREEERAARKDKIRALLNHDKIRKPDLAADARPDAENIKEDAIDLFKSQIAKLTEKGDITEAPKPKSDDLDL